jgi:hypothetical protein
MQDMKSSHMSHLNSFILILAIVASFAGRTAYSQMSSIDFEKYLQRHSLEDLLAEHLVEQLDGASGKERDEIAQKLGKLYVRLLDSSTEEDERKYWSDRASNLLRLVPESDSPELRINLSKAAYIRAESIAERARLRMASEAEISQAERILRDSSVTFLSIAQDANRSVQTLDRKMAKRLEEEEEIQTTQLLAEARQNRSLGFYYAGWSEYYLAMLTDDKARAGKALRHFGWLLSARDGEEASYDRLQSGLLQYEHVARASIGASLSCQELGRSIEAIAWLDSIERNTDVPQSIKDQVFDRRIWVYAKGEMWADLELQIRRSRASGSLLSPISARILVVACMDALVGSQGQGRSRELIRRLSDAGLQDLINAGEVIHVLELVREFGTEPLGDTGFIVLYVKGLLALDRANEARIASGDTGSGPVTDGAIAAYYREAANLLLASVDEEDASSHTNERIRAITSSGTAFFLSGDAVFAAEILERAVNEARTPEQAENALWLALVALEDAVENGDESLKPRRDQAAQLYLTTYAGNDRSARLLMRPGTAGLLPDSEAVSILLSIPNSSSNYLSARRQASQLLYRLYRNATGTQRTFASERFSEVAALLVRLEQVEIRGGDVARAELAAASIVLRTRQIAETALGISPPDIERATLALDTLERAATYATVDITKLQPEIAYRRLQIASARGDLAAINRWYTLLENSDGGYLSPAQRLLYRESVSAWISSPTDTIAARSVVRFGTFVIEQLKTSDSSSRAYLGVLETTAQAASTVWELEQDQVMLDDAIATYDILIESSGATPEVLRQQALLLESAKRDSDALDIWRRLVSGLDPGTEPWYEARYESIRLLIPYDRVAAETALQQHITLYPKLGPEPWASQFRQLARSLNMELPR